MDYEMIANNLIKENERLRRELKVLKELPSITLYQIEEFLKKHWLVIMVVIMGFTLIFEIIAMVRR